jgi:AcrR family transcriptional regulator
MPSLPAPGRGQYDRRQTRETRLAEQRARLVSAAAIAFSRHEMPTIESVVKIAGVSRNTFYEYFDDLAHARAAAAQRAQQRLAQELRAAEERTRTPVERLRAVAHAWVEWMLAAPADAALCLRSAREGLGVAARELEAALLRSASTLQASGVQVPEQAALHVTLVAGGAEVLARRLLTLGAGTTEGRPGRVDAERIERALAEVAVRLLR